MAEWVKVEGAAKDANGKYIALINGEWKPASGAAKDANGNYVAMMDDVQEPVQAKKEQPKQKSVIDVMSSPKSYLDSVYGVGEGIANIGSAMAGAAAGGLRGLYSLASGEGADEASRKVQETQGMMTYQPTTSVGQAIPKAVSIPLEVASDFSGKIGKSIGKPLGMEIGGQAIGEATPAIAATLFAGRAPIRSVAQGIEQGGRGLVPTIPKPQFEMPNVPVVSNLAGTMLDVIRTRSTTGHNALAKDYLKQQITNPREIELLQKELPKQTGEIVKGSTVTTADAIARANRAIEEAGTPERFGSQFVALEKKLGETANLSSTSVTKKLQAESARSNLLDKGAGTEAEYAAAVNNRTAKTAPLYRAAEQSTTPVNVNAAMQYIEAQLKKTGEPKLIAAMSAVKKGLTGESEIILPKGMASTRYMPAEIISSIKGINTMLGDVENIAVRRQLMGVKNILEHKLNQSVPEYKLASKTFMEESKPINQMDLWRKLREKSLSANEVETAGSYLKTLANDQKLIKDATGFKRGKDLNQYFDTQQMVDALNVAKELEAGLTKKRMLTEAKLGDGNTVNTAGAQLNLLNTQATIFNFMVKMLGKDAEIPVRVAAYEILSNPKKFSALMKELEPKQRKSMVKALKEATLNKETGTIALVTEGQQQ